MLNQKYKIVISFLVITILLMPSFGLAQEQLETVAPQTVGEAKDLATGILQKLPEAVRGVWREEALPILKKMLEWFLFFWKSTVGPVVEPWFNKQIEKRQPAIEQEFKKEREEMQKDLWERFKDLLK